MYNEMMDTVGLVNQADPELAAAMNRELNRQRENIELIASENIVLCVLNELLWAALCRTQ